MHHYTYKIQFLTGHVYYGVRSCKCLPEDDPYMGSPVTHREHWKKYPPIKTILGEYNSRAEAAKAERILIRSQWRTGREISLNVRAAGVCTPEHIIEVSKPFRFVNPQGDLIEGINLKAFCDSNDLPYSAMANVRSERVYQCYGWRNATPKNIGLPFEKDGNGHFQLYSFVNPDGDRVDVHNLAKFCRDNGLSEDGMRCVVSGNSRHHRGWRALAPETLGVQFCDDHPLAKSAQVVSPEGILFSFTNINAFCKKYNLKTASMCVMLNGGYGHHKGWRLATPESIGISFADVPHPMAKAYKFVSPDGQLFNVTNLRKFCEEKGLSKVMMGQVHNGKYRHHKGWTKLAGEESLDHVGPIRSHSESA